MKISWLLMALSTAGWISSAWAQADSATDDRPKFDVAAIRPNTAGGRGVQLSDGTGDGGRFTATNISLKQLIALAYHFQPQEIAGGPAWLNTERFDVEAKPEEGFVPTQEQTMEMLQTLLEERFQLKVQHQSKEGPIYALVVPKGGPKIKLSADQTPVPEQPQRGRGGPNGAGGGRGGFRGGGGAGGAAGAPGGGRGGFRGGGGGGPAAAGNAGAAGAQPAQAATGGQQAQGQGNPPAGAANNRQRQLNRPLARGAVMAGPGLLRGSAIKLEALTRPLTNQLGRPVVDRTNLTGLYDVQLTWTPDQLGGGGNSPFPRTESGPSIFTAIHEQLGLKIESSTGPIDSLVIEKVEQPTDN